MGHLTVIFSWGYSFRFKMCTLIRKWPLRVPWTLAFKKPNSAYFCGHSDAYLTHRALKVDRSYSLLKFWATWTPPKPNGSFCSVQIHMRSFRSISPCMRIKILCLCWSRTCSRDELPRFESFVFFFRKSILSCFLVFRIDQRVVSNSKGMQLFWCGNTNFQERVINCQAWCSIYRLLPPKLNSTIL